MRFLCIVLGVLSWASHSASLNIQEYDSHVELSWPSAGQEAVIERQISDGWEVIGTTAAPQVIDFIGQQTSARYRVRTSQGNKILTTAKATTRPMNDEALLEMVQRYTFRYFWDNADKQTGWIPERNPGMQEGNIVTTGGTGFGIAAIITAAQRGWITHEQAVSRLQKMTAALTRFERFHGMWAHWYNADTGQVFSFSEFDDGGDIVESAFMAQGLLTARAYFSGHNAAETQLRDTITGLWESMEWDWYTQGDNVLYWHWSKNHGWKMNHKITGYNEALIVYVLAASSPTHPIDPKVYHEGWAGWQVDTFRNYQDYYGMALPLGQKATKGGPLFFAHYSFMGLDPRGLRDQYANYWEQNKRHTLINRAYCIDNPYGWQGYGEDFWGLTAGDRVPQGYTAHAPGAGRDEGTITPTAALSSMPYTPDESMQVLKNLYRQHGAVLFGPMGFYDGINLSVSDDPQQQVRKTYLAIDQGPIIGMIENHRSGLLWDTFMQNQEVLDGLGRLGFSRDASVH